MPAEIEAPPVLYHYTDRVGLAGIIESKALWATDVSFLNDVTEAVYARELLVEIADRMDPGPAIDWWMHIPCGVARGVGTNETPPDTFVASFCAEGDLLGQWWRYADDGTGYAIGFDRQRLGEIGVAQGFSLVPLMYDRDDQIRHVEMLISDARRHVVERAPLGQLAQGEGVTLLLELGVAFIVSTFSVKNPYFRDEREWRLAHVAVEALWPSRAMGRNLRGDAALYEELSLVDPAGDTPIVEVVIGPGAPADAVEHAQQLLNEGGLSDAGVRTSGAPLRQ